MKTVYIVMWDNGQSYEDHAQGISAIFASKEDAETNVKDLIELHKFVPLTEEEYYAQPEEDINHTYQDYLGYAWNAWDYDSSTTWSVEEHTVIH